MGASMSAGRISTAGLIFCEHVLTATPWVSVSIDFVSREGPLLVGMIFEMYRWATVRYTLISDEVYQWPCARF